MIETIGAAGGTSAVIVIFFILGWNQRYGRIEDDIKSIIANVATLNRDKMAKDDCLRVHQFQEQVNTDRKNDVNEIKNSLHYITEKIDELVSHSRNGGK